jgi:hypothetical protein
MGTKALEEALRRLATPNHHHRDELLKRNGRWGTCVLCPREPSGFPHPEQCVETDRYDHQLRRENDEAWTELEAIRKACVRIAGGYIKCRPTEDEDDAHVALLDSIGEESIAKEGP